MKRKMRKSLWVLVICCCMFAGNARTVQAAQPSQPNLTKLTFDMDYYYNTYPDLQLQIGYDYNGLYHHYLAHGLREGRSGSAEFNCLVYRNNYADLQTAFGNDFAAYCKHYETHGKAEGRNAASGITTGGQRTEQQSTGQLPGTFIGYYTTAYNPDISRAVNVSVAASRINGVVIQPGQSFSFSRAILPRTTENGYVEAPVIVGKQYVPGMGGGICQVSSTLYAAMLSANLPATERHPHSLEVSYIPTGMDATVAGNAKDLKFVNIFNEPIQIYAVADNGVLTVALLKEK